MSTWGVTMVLFNHERRSVDVYAESGPERLACYFDPRTLADHVRRAAGERPRRSWRQMEDAIQAKLAGGPAEDPAAEWERKRRDVIAAYVRLMFCSGIAVRGEFAPEFEIPEEALTAIVDGCDWRARPVFA